LLTGCIRKSARRKEAITNGLDAEKTLNQLIIMLIVGVLILIGQYVGYGIPIADAIPGMLIIILISMLSLLIKDLLPILSFLPLLGFVNRVDCQYAFMPTAESVLKLTNQVNFLGTTTPILAIAGISVGNRLEHSRSLVGRSSLCLSCVCRYFFGSAIIAHIVLKIQGII